MPNRRVLPRFALCLLLFGCWIVASTAPAAAQSAIGQIKSVSGSVFIQRGGVSTPARLGDHLREADRLVTEKDGTVGITFIDNSMMSLGPESTLSLDRFRFDQTTHAGAFDSSLMRGTLAVKSGQIVKQKPEAMTVRTPASILGVRGTEFVVRVDAAATN